MTHDIRHLDPASARTFAGMTFPLYRERLRHAGHGPTLALAARVSGAPAGLVVAEPSSTDTLTLLSLFVERTYRRQGLGRHLLSHLEAAARDVGFRHLEGSYTAEEGTDPPVEHLLTREGWAPPSVTMRLYKVNSAFVRDRMLRRWRGPSDIVIVPWAELRDHERLALEGSAPLPFQYPERLSPAQDAAAREPLNSLALRDRHGEIGGWLVTHRIAPDTIRFTTLFVREDLRGRGCSVALIREAATRQHLALGDATWVTFGVLADNPGMLTFVRRVLTPYLDGARESRHRTKALA